MFNNIKKEIDKDFDKQKNYDTILSKVEGVSSMKSFKFRYALIPLCVIIIATVGISQVNFFKTKEQQIAYNGNQWPTKEIYANNLTQDSIAIVPRWDDLTICQQFSIVEYDGSTYDCKYGEVPAANIGNNLGSTTLIGYDIYAEKTYTKNASLYSINSISSKCAIALQFECTSEFYSYINAYYKPSTLKDFIKDLNLREIVSFGTIDYKYNYTDSEGNHHFDTIEFSDVDDEIIWSMLFSDTSLKNIHTDSLVYNTVIEIGVDIPILGYKNISCSLTEEGYLVTNILDTGKAFYIGKEKVEEFVNYIINNYEGYRIVYVDSNGNNFDDEMIQNENRLSEDSVVTVENNVIENVVSHSIN